MPSVALLASLLITITPPLPVQDTVMVSFIILNDRDQDQSFTIPRGQVGINQPEINPQPNVHLRGWYQDESLSRFFNFNQVIQSDTTVYARWDYISAALGLATLTQSIEGNRFESKTLKLEFPLFTPLKEGLRFQWQASSLDREDFQAIGGATQSTFYPFRNGTFQYRLRYRVPEYQESGTILQMMTYYSAPVTLTIYGQQSNILWMVLVGLLILAGIIYFLSYKRAVYYEVSGGEPLQPLRFRVGEDMSLQPNAKRKGYRFIGWFLDPELLRPFEGMRMPIHSMRLYAKFKKTKTNR